MSVAEDLCERSLRAVLKPDVEILKNYRPDFLKNPRTGRNLEIDFYLPQFMVALEIQGEHHYTDEAQKEKDALKRDRLLQQRIFLIELSIFQIGPSFMKRRLAAVAHTHDRRLLGALKPFDHSQLDVHNEVTKYKQVIRAEYGTDGMCQTPPETHAARSKRQGLADLLADRPLVRVPFKGQTLTARVVRLNPGGKKVLVRASGVRFDFFVRSNEIEIVDAGHTIT